MKTKFIAVCFGLYFIPTIAFSSPTPISSDKYWSPYAGADLLMSSHDYYKAVDDYYLPNSSGKTGFLWGSARLAKLFAQSILGNLIATTQHEVFGHGYRLREFGMGARYKVGFFGGSAAFSEIQYNNLNQIQKNMLISGGLESNTIFGQQVLHRWLLDENIDNRDVNLYSSNKLMSINYAQLTKDELHLNSFSNDISTYIKGVNSWHQNDNTLSVSKVRSNLLWNYFDPALYNGLYGAFISYVINAKPNEKLYMLEFGKYKYLPAGNVFLAPYGLEYQLCNYIKIPDNKLIQVNLRYGETGIIKSYALDVYYKHIWTYKNFSVSNKLSFWQQPRLNAAFAKDAKNRLGFAETLSSEYNFNDNIALRGEIGYKTSGYLPGTPLESGMIWRLGLVVS